MTKQEARLALQSFDMIALDKARELVHLYGQLIYASEYDDEINEALNQDSVKRSDRYIAQVKRQHVSVALRKIKE